jgi:hypothetical protein
MPDGGSEAQPPQDDLVLLDSEPVKPKTTATGGTPSGATFTTNAEPANAGTGTGTNVSGKTAVIPVSQVHTQTVSSLAGRNMSNAEFIEAFGQPRNMGFLTATAGTDAGTKNTISTGCIPKCRFLCASHKYPAFQQPGAFRINALQSPGS